MPTAFLPGVPGRVPPQHCPALLEHLSHDQGIGLPKGSDKLSIDCQNGLHGPFYIRFLRESPKGFSNLHAAQIPSCVFRKGATVWYFTAAFNTKGCFHRPKFS